MKAKTIETFLIPPIPKEYMTYSEEEAIARTEEIYEEIAEMYKQVDIIRDDYREKIDCLLQNKVSAGQLGEVFQDKDVRTLCRALNEFQELRGLCRIAEEEEVFQEPSVLQNFATMDEAVQWLQVCFFVLRDFEFDREVSEELLLLVQEKKLSYICLAEFILDNRIVRKVHTAERITVYLYENGQCREALLFLMRLEQKLPYSEQKIMTFAMALLDMGEHRLAYEVLMKYQNPNDDICQLQTELKGLLQENVENE